MRREKLSGTTHSLDLVALDRANPSSISVLVPPDEVQILPQENLIFDPAELDSFSSWSNAHAALSTTLVENTLVPGMAAYGRVQLEAYQLAPLLRILNKPRPSLLVADDVGLGKTIESGIVIAELMARGRADRTMIVVPPGLLHQWRDELAERFGLDFTVIENVGGLERVQSILPAGVSPWDALPRILTSLDYLKKETTLRRALRKTWDLIIVDEAHALAESGSPQNPYATQRTRLGHKLRENGRGLLLLTATPHNGYAHSFRSLLELVEPSMATLKGDLTEVARRVDAAMIRRMKDQIIRLKEDGTTERVFPKRTVEGLPVSLLPKERRLLDEVGRYCSKVARSAAGGDDEELISFAMQIIKKRALSSRKGLAETIDRRLKSLKAKADEPAPTRAEIREHQADLPLDDAAAERLRERILRAAVPKEEKARKAEVRALTEIQKLLGGLTGPDPKVRALAGEILRILKEHPDERIIVFTEYLDTIEAIREECDRTPELAGRWLVFRGGLSLREKSRIQEEFAGSKARVLLATDAASEGLNFQHVCRRVIHFELPWNPNRLEQRNGRVDRYGQTREPRIRYMFFPDSPEDAILHRLVGKIETIQEARVSTPDILGVLGGASDLGAGLVALEPGSESIEQDTLKLVRHFEDRTQEFIRDVQPLLTGGAKEADPDLLRQARPLVPDDDRLAQVVTELFGAQAVRETSTRGVVRIEVPARYRGPGVSAVYAKATFLRSVAARTSSEEVEYITPLHPLIRAFADDARRRLLQAYTVDGRVRRLAARRVPADQPPSALFTYLTGIQGTGWVLEERLLAIRVTPSLEDVSDPGKDLTFLSGEAPGEVRGDSLERAFKNAFPAMAAKAAEIAARRLNDRADELGRERNAVARRLEIDLDRDVQARLVEIDEEETRGRGLVEPETQQLRLFAEGSMGKRFYAARRERVGQYADERRRDIADFRQVKVEAPRPLGALFLVPEGGE
ncbi:MAG: DEAD/DEAH box helicase family protein [Planctomycetes bacterium]|nr:DEAD/DEAH box helicase family protein [Planctomycetota bacterium]